MLDQIYIYICVSVIILPYLISIPFHSILLVHIICPCSAIFWPSKAFSILWTFSAHGPHAHRVIAVLIGNTLTHSSPAQLSCGSSQVAHFAANLTTIYCNHNRFVFANFLIVFNPLLRGWAQNWLAERNTRSGNLRWPHGDCTAELMTPAKQSQQSRQPSKNKRTPLAALCCV